MRQILGGNGHYARSLAGQTRSDYRNRLGRLSAILMLGGLACGLLASLATSARAGDVSGASDPIAALRSYVQSGDAAQTSQANPSAAAAPGSDRDFNGDVYAPLRGFSQPSIADQPQSIRNLPKVAEADNAFDALQQFLNGTPSESAAPISAPPPKGKGKGKAAKSKGPSEPVAATTVGSKVCLGCHTGQAAAFNDTLMGRLQQQGRLDCETCHGPGSAHVKAGGGVGVGGIISFRSDDTSRSAEENNGLCLGCHDRGQRVNWPGSTHEERGLACTNCHTVMKAVSRQYQLKTAFQADTCFQCHKDRRAQMFLSSHMPMREGKVVCSDCHNPHGSITEALLNKNSVNDVCYTCHAEKRGPFLFEHEPVRENCLNCHDPHGSINQFSLKIPRPRLCMECHSLMNVTGGLHSDEGGMGASCQNCHVQIHGSNSPNGAFFFR